jgi:4-hydroxybenzoate polyprenyltransferase
MALTVDDERTREDRAGRETQDPRLGTRGGAALFRLLRPKQWVKNAVLLAGIIFTLGHAHPLSDWLRVLAGIVIFCFLSSAIYVVNDLCDLEQDRKHPRKRYRPLASGEVSIGTGRAVAALLAATGLAGAMALGPLFGLTAVAYVVLTVGYSLYLKHVVVIDAMALSLCYVARAVAGAVVIGVDISPWLLVCTFLGALLIGFAKRRNELIILEDAGSHRRILEEYTIPMLDQMIGIVTACTLTAYMLYTFSSRTAQERPMMMLTIPFVVYGIFRFFYLVHRHGKGGDPSSELIEDRNLILCGLLWALTCALIMGFGR